MCHSVGGIKRLIFLYKTDCFVKESASVQQIFDSKTGENLVVYSHMPAHILCLI